MPRDVEPIGPRAAKEDFMRALKLKSGDPQDEKKYRAMRDEAIAVYTNLNADRRSLVDEKKNDTSVQPPFFWHHIRAEVRRQAVIDTWQQASPGTPQRRLFDMGATTGEYAPNWVTQWLLYSVFRSRDIRNNRSRRPGESGSSSGSVGSSGCGSRDGRIYDPLRDAYVSR